MAKRSVSVGVKAALIGGCAVIVAAILGVVVPFSRKESPTVGAGIIATTSGNNSPVVIASGNNSTVIQGAQGVTVNNGISEATMRALLRDKSIAANAEFAQKYPHGYVILGAINGKILSEPFLNSIQIDADWEHATLTIDWAHQMAVYFIPHLSITSTNGQFELGDNHFVFSYIDNKLTPISLGVTAIWLEVLDADKGIFLIGFK